MIAGVGGPGYRAPHESQWLTDLVNGCVSTLLLIHQVSLDAEVVHVHPERIRRYTCSARIAASLANLACNSVGIRSCGEPEAAPGLALCWRLVEG